MEARYGRCHRIGDASDDALIGELACGRFEALSVLYDRHAASALTLAKRITGDPTIAEDVVQDAFLSIWRSSGSYSARRASGRTWILALVRHRAIDATRGTARRERASLGSNDAVAIEVADTADEPVLAVIREETARGARAAMRALPLPQREILWLTYFEELTNTETAALVDIPLGTVKSRLRLGLAKLHDRLADPAPADA